MPTMAMSVQAPARSLYKGKECVEHNIPEGEAVEHLLKLIKEDRKS